LHVKKLFELIFCILLISDCQRRKFILYTLVLVQRLAVAQQFYLGPLNYVSDLLGCTNRLDANAFGQVDKPSPTGLSFLSSAHRPGTTCRRPDVCQLFVTDDLHWLLVRQRVVIKIRLLVYMLHRISCPMCEAKYCFWNEL